MVESLKWRTNNQIEQAGNLPMRPRPSNTIRKLIRYVAPRVVSLLVAVPLPAQMFSQPQVVAAPSWPTNILAADFDGDSNQDLLYLSFVPNTPTGQPDTLVEIAYGNGRGGFSAPVLQGSLYSVGGISTTVWDVNGDGISDFVIAEGPVPPARQTTFTVWFGSPQRRLQPAAVPSKWLLNGTRVVSVGMQHFYGYPTTLMAVDNGNNAMVLSVDQSGNFSPKLNWILSGGAGPFFWQDLNGDGNPDLVVLSQSGHAVDVYLATGYAPPFYAPTRYTGVSGAYSILLTDVDQDTHPDLVIEGANGRFDIFHGNADGTFQTASEGGSGSLDGATGNGGHLIGIDTVASGTRRNFYTATPAGISALIGQGNLTYALKGIYNAGPGRSSYALADFNNDGNLDLAVDSPEGIAILYGNSDGSFQTNQAFAAGLPAMSGTLGAFTSPGNLDAVVATGATQGQFLQGAGDGTFSYAGSPGTPIPTSTNTGGPGVIGSVLSADLNGDGKLDLVFTGDGSNANLPANGTGLFVQLGNGDGTFQTPVAPNIAQQFSYPSSASCSPPFNHFPGIAFGASAVADFNGDGLADIANRDAGAYRVLRGNNGTSSSSYTMIPTLFSAYVDGSGTAVDCDAHAHDLAIAGDLNGDGRPDILFQGSQGSSGSLLEFLTDPTGLPVQTGDLAVDGSLTTPGQLTAPALSSTFNGPAIPTSAGGLGFPAFIGSAVIADLDRDGNNDVIVSYANLSANRAAPAASAPNSLYIWFGSGGGKFLTSAKHRANPVVLTPSRNFYQVAVADLNGDGIPDLILSDGYILSVQFGAGDGTFGAETHYLAGQGLNTISVADVNHDGKLDLVVANGGTVWGNPVANLDQPPTAQDVNSGGITVLLNHATTPLSTITATVAASPEPSAYAGFFSLTATITSSPTNSNPVTGSFTFSANGTLAGTATISGLTATLLVPSSLYSALRPGTYPITAVYSGDSNYAAATFTGTHAVSPLPTTISLLLCVDPPGSNFPCANPIDNTPLISPITMYYGQSLDGVAIESANNLTGTLTFLSNTTAFCTLNANLLQGAQTCPPTSGIFPAGTTTVTAVYSGDSVYTPSTSNGIVVTVLPDIITTATVTSSLNPAPFGQPVTFTANVQGNFAAGAGQVIFLDGATTLGTATLDPTGHATLTTSTLAPGPHPISIAFPASQNFHSATSAALNQVILPPATPLQSNVALASSLNPSTQGQTVTFTATVTASATFPVIPTGTVTFFDGTLNLGNSVVNPATGIATFATSTLAIGSHPITAAYSGAAGNGSTTPAILASTSTVLTQTVLSPIPPSFTLTVSPSPLTVGVGDTGILLVNVQALGGFSQPVALTCAGLPTESTCAFVLPTIPAGGGSTTLQLAVSAPHNCGSSTPYFVSSNSLGTPARIALSTLFGGGFLLAAIRRRRRLLLGTVFALLVSLCGLSLLSGCGACTDLGTKPGVYSFTVVGTARGEVESQKIPLTVTIP